MKSNISIIVPIYNAENYLKRCIDSLVNQTYKNIEVILINDGSTDNSEKIIKEYKDKRIKYFKNKNQGIGKTRNFGIDKSTGEYIMFCDSDDYFEINACEELIKKAEKEKLDLVICDYYRDIDDKKQEDRIISFENTTLKKRPSLLNEVNLSPWNKIYSSKLIKDNKIKFNEELKYEDTPFVIESFDKAKKIGKVDKCLYNYVIHSNSETTVRDRRCFDILKIIDIVRTYFKDKDYALEELNKLNVRMITNYTVQQRVQIDKKVGMEFIDEAFAYLEKEIPDYKDNKYYKTRGFLRRTIEKSKLLTKIYCKLYRRK